MRLRAALWALSVVALGLGATHAQETKKTDDSKHIKIDDGVARATRRAKKFDAYVLARVTVAPSDGGDMILAEYVTGEMMLYHASGDDREDQYILLTKDNACLLHEAMNRQSVRGTFWPR